MTANRMIFLLMLTYEWLYSPFFFIEMEPASRFWSKEHRKSSKNFKKTSKKTIKLQKINKKYIYHLNDGKPYDFKNLKILHRLNDGKPYNNIKKDSKRTK